MTSNHALNVESGRCDLECTGCEACTVDSERPQSSGKPDRGIEMLQILFADKAALADYVRAADAQGTMRSNLYRSWLEHVLFVAMDWPEPERQSALSAIASLISAVLMESASGWKGEPLSFLGNGAPATATEPVGEDADNWWAWDTESLQFIRLFVHRPNSYSADALDWLYPGQVMPDPLNMLHWSILKTLEIEPWVAPHDMALRLMAFARDLVCRLVQVTLPNGNREKGASLTYLTGLLPDAPSGTGVTQ